ncbi:hypothetical protein ES708_12803 [subsurface metagenome]
MNMLHNYRFFGFLYFFQRADMVGAPAGLVALVGKGVTGGVFR